jgi:Domain of unknown function (DUF5666)
VRSAISAFRLGISLLGTVVLAGAMLPAHADGPAASQPGHVDGVVAAQTATSLQIHPALGADVTLTLTSTTQIQVDGKADDPASPETADALPPAPNTAPDPTSFVGLYARAQYDPTSLEAIQVELTQPVPLHAEGVVHDTSDHGFSLDLSDNQQPLVLTVGTDTAVRLNGRPATIDQLAPGDRAEVAFLLTPTENHALRVKAEMAPPRAFSGSVAAPGAGGGAPDTFSASDGSTTLTFTVDTNTAIRINGKPASVTDLVAGQGVHVLYRDRGGVLLALRVSAQKLKKGGEGAGGDAGANHGKGTTGRSHGKGHGGKDPTGTGEQSPKGTSGHGRGKGHGPGDRNKGTEGDAGDTPEKGSNGDSGQQHG